MDWPMAKSCRPPSTSETAPAATIETVQADTAGEPVEARRVEQARAVCLRLLTARARTRAELAAHLTKRGYPDEIRDQVLDRLVETGLVDDSDFAEQWVRSRREHAGKGRRVLAAELRTKGVDDDLIAQALDGIDAAAERERAERLVRAKLRRQSFEDAHAEARLARRLVAMLVRRGYGHGMAYDTVSAELSAERERRYV